MFSKLIDINKNLTKNIDKNSTKTIRTNITNFNYIITVGVINNWHVVQFFFVSDTAELGV